MILNDCVVLITGSSSGIGAATAKAFAKHGCKVAVTWSKDKDGGEQTAAACRAAGAEVLLHQLDVTNDQQCREVIREIAARWGRLDVLVNSAGITTVRDPSDLEALSGQDFFDAYNVNVVGVFQIVRAAAPLLSARPIAHVVNLASTAAINGRGSSIAYAASKGALVTMTKSLARAMGPNVRVNVVCPGLVESSWAKKSLGDKKMKAQSRFASMRSPLKRLPTPEDVAAIVVSCAAGFDLVTGQTIVVDGGAHLGTAFLATSPKVETE